MDQERENKLQEIIRQEIRIYKSNLYITHITGVLCKIFYDQKWIPGRVLFSRRDGNFAFVYTEPLIPTPWIDFSARSDHPVLFTTEQIFYQNKLARKFRGTIKGLTYMRCFNDGLYVEFFPPDSNARVVSSTLCQPFDSSQTDSLDPMTRNSLQRELSYISRIRHMISTLLNSAASLSATSTSTPAPSPSLKRKSLPSPPAENANLNELQTSPLAPAPAPSPTPSPLPIAPRSNRQSPHILPSPQMAPPLLDKVDSNPLTALINDPSINSTPKVRLTMSTSASGIPLSNSNQHIQHLNGSGNRNHFVPPRASIYPSPPRLGSRPPVPLIPSKPIIPIARGPRPPSIQQPFYPSPGNRPVSISNAAMPPPTMKPELINTNQIIMNDNSGKIVKRGNIPAPLRYELSNDPFPTWKKVVLIPGWNSQSEWIGKPQIQFIPPGGAIPLSTKEEVKAYILLKEEFLHLQDSIDAFDFREVFCLCHKPEISEVITYMECMANVAGCNRWFHPECAGWDRFELDVYEYDIICPLCTEYMERNPAVNLIVEKRLHTNYLKNLASSGVSQLERPFQTMRLKGKGNYYITNRSVTERQLHRSQVEQRCPKVIEQGKLEILAFNQPHRVWGIGEGAFSYCRTQLLPPEEWHLSDKSLAVMKFPPQSLDRSIEPFIGTIDVSKISVANSSDPSPKINISHNLLNCVNPIRSPPAPKLPPPTLSAPPPPLSSLPSTTSSSTITPSSTTPSTTKTTTPSSTPKSSTTTPKSSTPKPSTTTTTTTPASTSTSASTSSSSSAASSASSSAAKTTTSTTNSLGGKFKIPWIATKPARNDPRLKEDIRIASRRNDRSNDCYLFVSIRGGWKDVPSYNRLTHEQRISVSTRVAVSLDQRVHQNVIQQSSNATKDRIINGSNAPINGFVPLGDGAIVSTTLVAGSLVDLSFLCRENCAFCFESLRINSQKTITESDHQNENGQGSPQEQLEEGPSRKKSKTESDISSVEVNGTTFSVHSLCSELMNHHLFQSILDTTPSSGLIVVHQIQYQSATSSSAPLSSSPSILPPSSSPPSPSSSLPSISSSTVTDPSLSHPQCSLCERSGGILIKFSLSSTSQQQNDNQMYFGHGLCLRSLAISGLLRSRSWDSSSSDPAFVASVGTAVSLNNLLGKYQCSLCGQQKGVTFCCNDPTCYNQAHHICALQAGWDIGYLDVGSWRKSSSSSSLSQSLSPATSSSCSSHGLLSFRCLEHSLKRE